MDFKSALVNYYDLSEEDWQTTIQYFKPVKMKAKEFFVKEDEVANQLGYIKKGLFRTYRFDDRGDELTLDFNEPETTVLSAESFNKRIPAQEYIIAMEDAELLCISYEDMMKLYEQIPLWMNICRHVAEIKNQQLVNRSIEFQTLTAKERYQQFCKEHPLVCRTAAVGQIASYLGIDIATLSRIRKKLVF